MRKADRLQRGLILCQCFTIISILFLLGEWPKGTEWLFWTGAVILLISIVLQGVFLFLILRQRRKR